ncbi:sensor histidine kinase [Paeniglutamicibacter kerguelensis]|uniref:histidine kinase n=1 Tax=Paeniglutamicibacter kerguelensis TaxID=254788 RepID=A0ABS4XI67_9MICC|nr:sensor histidine kinase [Paeniglutamicibacter kerguelensis]MBP2388167.1 signal transduction histidine kinase [Paeniglutamicibacter kerguelensis]
MSENLSKEAAGTPEVSFDELSAQRVGRLRSLMRRKPRGVDAAVVLLYFLLSLPSIIDSALSAHWPTVALLVVTGFVLYFRRRWPMAILILVAVTDSAATLLDSSYLGSSTGLWIALYTASTQYAARRMFILTILISALQGLIFVVIGIPGMFTDSPEDQQFLADVGGRAVLTIIGVAFLVGSNVVFVAIGSAVRNHRLHEAELNNWAVRVQTLAQVRERNRIAREMHDVVAHSLSVMIALSDGASVVLKRDPQRAGEVLAELSATGRHALADMRRVIGVLRTGDDASLEPQPAVDSMEKMLEGFTVAGLPLRFTQSGPPLPKDATFQLTVYRIIQESLTNVLRYGRNVTRVGVLVERNGDEVSIRVNDDGTQQGGRREAVGSAQGIRGMGERAALFDGTLTAGPSTEGGWGVVATLKLPHPAAGANTAAVTTPTTETRTES